ncbi:hypothetical protein roselon_02129 [Roseibacterium elongatum DSM 19469]|uniref:Uncharacterized protein n=1 Tax=Roseicyclus elongatus DSM 19469 TaxID=1294273 RepID=W8RTD8_9RHOB|nr:Stf0 family sulfotransferase [Roseibacterium elongatum]AHM04474.1 hypothetical protein roselon_02129 [Roseibacterium elongatum DSM 19469]
MVFCRARSKGRAPLPDTDTAENDDTALEIALDPEPKAVDRPDPLLDGGYEVLRRSALVYSNFRSGTHMLRSSLIQLTDFQTGGEVFARTNTASGSFSDYVAQPETNTTDLLLDPERHLPLFLAHHISTLDAANPVLFDVKYSQAARLGVDDMTLAPTVLKFFVALHVPILHVIRRDVVAQAISHLLAEQRGRFHAEADASGGSETPTAPVWLNPSEVCDLAQTRREEQRRAQAHLTAISADVCTIFYEDLSGTTLVPELRRISRFLGRYTRVDPGYKPPTRAQNSRLDVANRVEIYDLAMERMPGLVL